MKTVFSNSEVVHVFASQTQNEGRNSTGSIFFEGDTIYSYGRHFPMAKIVGNIVLFNNSSYSATTSQHQSDVRQALSHKTFINCSNINISKLDKVGLQKELETMQAEIFELCAKQKRARVYDYRDEIKRARDNFTAFAWFFKVRTNKAQKAIIWNFDIEKASEIQIEVDKKRKEKIKRDLIKQQKKVKHELDAWKAGEQEYCPRCFETVFLRLSKDQKEVETSKGAKVPVIEARALYAVLKAGKFDKLAGRRIGYYTIDRANSKTVKIGCHLLTVKEIERVLNSVKVG